MRRLVVAVEAADEDKILDALRAISEVGLPTAEPSGEDETSDGARVSWRWEPPTR